MKISTDEKLNPRLRGHVQTLRGSMVEALNKNPLPNALPKLSIRINPLLS
jgi:hypothetical protein